VQELIAQIWEFLSTNAQQIIIGLIVAAIVSVLAFPVRKWIIRSREQKKQQEERLRLHFKELDEEARAILSEAKISEMYGLIVTYAGGIPQYHPDLVGIELPKLPDSFEAHFPKETEMYGNYISRILRNNKGYKELRQKIKTDFESEGIPIVNISPPPKTSPIIYDAIFWPLFSWWKDDSQGKPKPWPNFEQIETTADFGPNHLVVAGWGSQSIAYGETEDDRKRCKRAISEVVQNKEFEREAVKTIQLANKVLKEFRTFKRELINTLDDIEKLWPGTQSYKFKREKKKCSRCKQIFS